MLCSSDWNAHLPEVPPAGEDPPPQDGIPHPLFGEALNAEQLYQMQLKNWMAQHGAGNNVAEEVGENAAVQVDIEIQPQWGEGPPSPPPAPPALYNFQEWLANEGLQVQDGILPSNNLQDSPFAAWNDSISQSSSATSSDSGALVLVPVNIMQAL